MTQEPLNADETEVLAEEEDPVMEECIRDALGPYLEILSPEEIADHRRLLVAFITTHPVAVPLYERLRKRPTNLTSGEVARDGAPVEDRPQDAGNRTVGGRR